MGLTYLDTLISRFGNEAFTTSEFEAVTGNTRPAKLLSELKMRGVVERMGRGKYRVLPLSERADTRIIEWARVKSIILRAPWDKAWTGSTAVEIWTNGRYKISPNPYLRVFHLLVHKSEIEEWKKYLRRSGVSYTGKKRVGSFVDLKATSKINLTLIAGEPVIPKAEVLRIIENNPGLYAEASELIEY
ncbi:MAG: hypothetical protein ACYCT2_01120 [Thermoplasmataceae archaeon]